MPTVITSSEANFARAAKWLPPGGAYLEYLALFGQDQESRHNYALGKPNATEVGTIELADGYGSFANAADYVQTNIPDLPRGTLIAVVKASSLLATQTPIISCLRPSSGAGGGLYYNNTGNGGTFWDRSSGEQQTATAGTVSTIWRMLAVRFDDSRQRIDDLTGGTHAEVSALGRRILSADTFRIGSNYGSTGAEVQIGLAAISSRYLADDELGAFYAWGDPLMASRGITI